MVTVLVWIMLAICCASRPMCPTGEGDDGGGDGSGGGIN